MCGAHGADFMSGLLTDIAAQLAPTADSNQSNTVVRLAGSGAGPRRHGPLPAGRMATIIAATDCRVIMGSSSTLQADAEDVFLAAGAMLRWYVDSNSTYVAIHDSSAEAHVWTSSGPSV